ncbi:MAG: hypothetical protein HY336_00640 [Candidatus Doudnabacteria bacterium]|nr:hypothetical protein [Candidatus Doudnabacteria bacterium]
MGFSETGSDGDKRDFSAGEVREMIQDIIHGQKEFALPELSPTDRGGLIGLLAGVKPALEIEGRGVDPVSLAETLGKSGIDLQVAGGMIINPGAVEKRVMEEPELASDVGWDKGENILEFINSNNLYVRPSGEEDPKWHSKRGFLLGFPRSAIKSAEKAWGIARSKDVPLFSDASGQRMSLQDEETYKERYGNKLTSEELDFLLYEDRIFIEGPDYLPVYHFRIFGKEAQQAKDIDELARQVKEVFNKLGFDL